MGVGAGLSMYVVVVQKFTFAISSPDEFLFLHTSTFSAFQVSYKNALYKSTVIIILRPDSVTEFGFYHFSHTGGGDGRGSMNVRTGRRITTSLGF